MPREPRIEYAGAAYHAMNRGTDGIAIYRDTADQRRFVDLLREVCLKTGWRIHAYVLMLNHFHILVETPEPNLALGMKWLLGTYAAQFNARHKRKGHLFHGRYKAVPVERKRGNYMLTVSDYIHLNPPRAGVVAP